MVQRSTMVQWFDRVRYKKRNETSGNFSRTIILNLYSRYLKVIEKDLCFELGLLGNKYQNQVYIFYSECVKLFWGFFIGEKGYGKYPREFRSVRIQICANMSCCSKEKSYRKSVSKLVQKRFIQKAKYDSYC